MREVLLKISDLVLLLLQWLLVLWGAFLFLMAYVVYRSDLRRLIALKEAASQAPATGDGYFFSPLKHAIYTVESGLIAMGLGAVLFYLRRLYLRRRP